MASIGIDFLRNNEAISPIVPCWHLAFVDTHRCRGVVVKHADS